MYSRLGNFLLLEKLLTHGKLMLETSASSKADARANEDTPLSPGWSQASRLQRGRKAKRYVLIIS